MRSGPGLAGFSPVLAKRSENPKIISILPAMETALAVWLVAVVPISDFLAGFDRGIERSLDLGLGRMFHGRTNAEIDVDKCFKEKGWKNLMIRADQADAERGRLPEDSKMEIAGIIFLLLGNKLIGLRKKC